MPLIFCFLLIYLSSLFMSIYIKDSDISFIFSTISIIIGCIPIVLITFIICFEHGIILGIFIGLLLLLLFINKIIKFLFEILKQKKYNRKLIINYISF